MSFPTSYGSVKITWKIDIFLPNIEERGEMSTFSPGPILLGVSTPGPAALQGRAIIIKSWAGWGLGEEVEG